MNLSPEDFREYFDAFDWFEEFKSICDEDCDLENLEICKKCWKGAIKRYSVNLRNSFKLSGIIFDQGHIFHCIGKFPMAVPLDQSECRVFKFFNLETFYSNQFENDLSIVENNDFKEDSENLNFEIFEISLPKNRARTWWALEVNLPCKPKFFSFKNIFCLSNEKAGTYLLAQNELSDWSDTIYLMIGQSDQCKISKNDVAIEWRNSYPSQAFPQFSSLPSFDQSLHETSNQSSASDLLVYFNQVEAQKYKNSLANQKPSDIISKRIKRDDEYEIYDEYYEYNYGFRDDCLSAERSRDIQIGLEFPCRPEIDTKTGILILYPKIGMRHEKQKCENDNPRMSNNGAHWTSISTSPITR